MPQVAGQRDMHKKERERGACMCVPQLHKEIEVREMKVINLWDFISTPVLFAGYFLFYL